MFKKFLEDFKSYLLIEKVCWCLGVLSVILLLILGALFFFQIGSIGPEVLIFLFSVTEMCQAVVDWRRNRWLGILSAVAAVVLLSMAFFIAG